MNMKLFQKIILGVLIFLSAAAGAAKVFKVPQEAAFFESAGLGLGVMMALGAVQIIGAGLSILPKFRTPGGALMGVGFLASAIVILMTGNIPFAAFSLLPVLLTGYVIAKHRAG